MPYKRLNPSFPAPLKSGPIRSFCGSGVGILVGIIVILAFVATREPPLLQILPNVSSQHSTATPKIVAESTSRVVDGAGQTAFLRTNERSKRGSFLSEYRDPNHPNCERSIVAAADSTSNSRTLPVVVSGTDGTPGCPPDGSGEAWTVEGRMDELYGTIQVDFSSKGGHRDLMGQKIPEGILWEDGNTWSHRWTE